MIDERLRVWTPEGALITLAPAGPVVRACAWLADLVVRGLLYLLLAFFLMRAGAVGWGLMLLLMFLLEWFYPVFFELLWRGQTPGKRLLGLRVISENATPVSGAASLLRNLLRAADFFPALYLTGFMTMLLNARNQRLGDLAAATLVVHDHPGRQRPPADAEEGVPADWPLNAADRHLLLAFLERWPALSPERREELARLALPDAAPGTAAGRLRAHALHELGSAEKHAGPP